MEDGDRIRPRRLVVTTGTFLNGLIHVGPEQRPAGRHGEPPSRELAESIRSFGFEMGRLKTGTPPRLIAQSIDFDAAAWRAATSPREDGDAVPVAVFVFDQRTAAEPASAAGCCYTNERVRDLVRQIHRSESAVQRTDSGHRAALLSRRSKTRSCGSPTASVTRSISSRKASTSTRST